MKEKPVMMQSSMKSGQMPAAGQSGVGQAAADELGSRADALWRRLLDIERALAVQEWWMLGRELPEARLLSEVSSLLAVARGELENVLSQAFGRFATSGQSDVYPTVAPEQPHPDDPAWLAASKDQAIGLLRMVAGALQPMLQYAQMLRTYGERIGLASAAVDAFGIVVSRLSEVDEAMRQPLR